MARSALTSVVIPIGVTSIGNGAFKEIDDAALVHFIGTEQEWDSMASRDEGWTDVNPTIHWAQRTVAAATLEADSQIVYACPEGSCDYSLAGVKKAKIKKFFKVNAKTGQATIKKKLKKGTYKVTVKVSATGDANHKASAAKSVTFKVKVA